MLLFLNLIMLKNEQNSLFLSKMDADMLEFVSFCIKKMLGVVCAKILILEKKSHL